MPIFQMELSKAEELIASKITATKLLSQYNEEEKSLFDKMEAAAKKFETLGIIAVLLGELLDLKIDQYKVSLCNEIISFHVNDFEHNDLSKLSSFFEFLFGYKLIVTDSEMTLDFTAIDQVI